AMNPSDSAVSQPEAAITSPAGGEPGTRASTRAGIVLAVLAALLAGLQASAPAPNSDLWRHLVARESLTVGRVPSHDASLDGPPGAVPATTSWLYDVFLYAGFRLLGGPGLVALNACLAALLAVVVLSAGLSFLTGRSGTDTVFAGACTLLAL